MYPDSVSRKISINSSLGLHPFRYPASSSFARNYSRASEPFNKLVREYEIVIMNLTRHACIVHRVAVTETASSTGRRTKNQGVGTLNRIMKGLHLPAPFSLLLAFSSQFHLPVVRWHFRFSPIFVCSFRMIIMFAFDSSFRTRNEIFNKLVTRPSGDREPRRHGNVINCRRVLAAVNSWLFNVI